MIKKNLNTVIALILIVAFGITFIESSARAENAPGVVYIDVAAFGWDCPQHITRHYTESEFAQFQEAGQLSEFRRRL